MTKTQVTNFMTVARVGSFTKAANMLYISQPAISKSISSMEAELGFPLFVRRDNSLALTEAGRRLRDFFLNTAKEYEELMGQIAGAAESLSGIRLGCPDTWHPPCFLGRIREHFGSAHPELQLTVECGKLSELMIGLREGALDIVLTHDFYNPYQYGIASEYLTATGCGILYSKERFGENISLDDLKDVDFLLYDGEIQRIFETMLRDICAGHFVPELRTAGQLSTALFRMACGDGVMLFSDWDSAAAGSAYGYLPVNKQLPVRMIYAADTTNDAVSVFLKEAPGLFE